MEKYSNARALIYWAKKILESGLTKCIL